MDKHTKVEIHHKVDCDMCKTLGVKKEAKYDAKTTNGQWGYLCQDHFDSMGIGLGLGKGQELVFNENGGQEDGRKNC